MYSVVRPAKLNKVAVLRLLMILSVANALVLSTGCSWFKKGKETPVATVTPPTQPVNPNPTDTMGTPPSAPAEGPRAGDLLPFPELKVIYFDFDRSNIRPDQLARVEFNLKYLKDHPEDKVYITGHTDERGTVEYNFALGERRAASVRDYYVKNGIDAARIQIQSKGEEEPVALGHDEEAWSKNRRAEFQRWF